MLKAREHACKLINKMFGLNVWVERRSLETPNIDEIEVNKNIDIEEGEE